MAGGESFLDPKLRDCLQRVGMQTRELMTAHLRERNRKLNEILDAEERDARLAGKEPYAGDWETRYGEALRRAGLDAEPARAPPGGDAPAG
jgi:hypothetical protein